MVAMVPVLLVAAEQVGPTTPVAVVRAGQSDHTLLDQQQPGESHLPTLVQPSGRVWCHLCTAVRGQRQLGLPNGNTSGDLSCPTQSKI